MAQHFWKGFAVCSAVVLGWLLFCAVEAVPRFPERFIVGQAGYTSRMDYNTFTRLDKMSEPQIKPAKVRLKCQEEVEGFWVGSDSAFVWLATKHAGGPNAPTTEVVAIPWENVLYVKVMQK